MAFTLQPVLKRMRIVRIKAVPPDRVDRRFLIRPRLAVSDSLPEAVADHGDGAGVAPTAPVIGLAQDTAEYCRHAEHVEERPTHPEAVDELGFAASREIESLREARCSQAGEYVGALPELLPHGIGPARAGVVERHDPRRREQHQTFRILHRQGAKQQGVHQRKDCRIGADAERERQDRDRGHDSRRR
jgi:hypothetical protein